MDWMRTCNDMVTLNSRLDYVKINWHIVKNMSKCVSQMLEHPKISITGTAVMKFRWQHGKISKRTWTSIEQRVISVWCSFIGKGIHDHSFEVQDWWRVKIEEYHWRSWCKGQQLGPSLMYVCTGRLQLITTSNCNPFTVLHTLQIIVSAAYIQYSVPSLCRHHPDHPKNYTMEKIWNFNFSKS
jgi:hypothetical protein